MHRAPGWNEILRRRDLSDSDQQWKKGEYMSEKMEGKLRATIDLVVWILNSCCGQAHSKHRRNGKP